MFTAFSILVDTRLTLEEQLKDVETLSEYPVSEFIMVIGLLCMLATEHLHGHDVPEIYRKHRRN